MDAISPERTAHPFVSRISLGRIAIVVAVLFAVWRLADVVTLVFFAILLGAVLRGAADIVSAKTRMPVSAAIALIVILIFALFIGLGYWMGPQMVAQGQDLVTRLTGVYQGLQQRFSGSPVLQHISGMAGNAGQQAATRLVQPVEEVLSLSFRGIAGLLVVFVITLYFAISPALYVNGMIALVPVQRRRRVRQVMEEVAVVLRRWFLGQLIDMIVVGVLSSIGLWVAGVPVPFAIGLLAGLFTFVPYFGTVVSGAIAVLIAFSVSLETAGWALGVFVLCHLIEGYVVSPLVQKRLVELPPALTVLAMTVLGSLFGFLGIVLGTPLAATALVMVRMLYVGDVLGDHASEPPNERPR